MDDFLKIEYEQCLSLMKYYDDRQMSLMKYATGLSSSVISIIFAFHKINNSPSNIDWGFISIISLVTIFGLLTLLLSMAQNRLYFIYPARQVNAIRNTFLSMVKDKFQNNQMYTSTSFSAFKWFSTQSLMIVFVGLQVGIYSGLLYYSTIIAKTKKAPCLWWPIIIMLVVSLILYAGLGVYLVEKSKQSPDKSVHSLDQGEQS